MPNLDIGFDMEQFKHKLEQIEVSKADKTKPERNLKHESHDHFRITDVHFEMFDPVNFFPCYRMTIIFWHSTLDGKGSM